MTEPLARADLEEAFQKLRENNGKQVQIPDCLNQWLLEDVKARQWFRFVMTGIVPDWMEN